MMQRPLGVEQMSDHPGAVIDGLSYLSRGRVAVPDADQHARPGELIDGGQGAVTFWRQRDQLEQPAPSLQQLGHGRGRGRGDPGLVVRAPAVRSDERAFDVYSENPGA